MTQVQERRRHLQALELNHRLAWLEDHIQRFKGKQNFAPVVAAWQQELCSKRALKLDLQSGLDVDQRRIDARTNDSQTNVERFLQSQRRRVATLFRE